MVTKKNKNSSDIIGFKDFLDERDKKQPRINKRSLETNFELLTFLERESDRLGKIITVYDEKTHNIREYPQDTTIIAYQEANMIEAKIDTIELLKVKGSPFLKNLEDTLSAHFNF